MSAKSIFEKWKSVIKLNDAIYYNSWEDYLHNYFFPDTAYELLGFTKDEDIYIL